MNSWTPLSPEELLERVAFGEAQMNAPLTRLWNLIRVDFAKWQLHPWGDEGQGFWGVGVIGNRVLWYNDIEDGFNWSRYSKPGIIDEYWCNQDELHHSLHQLQHELNGGAPSPKAGPPQPIQMDEV